MSAAETLEASLVDSGLLADSESHWATAAQAALDALKSAGYRVVELPKQDVEGSLAWSAFDLYEVSVCSPFPKFCVQIGTEDSDWIPGEPIAAAVARAYGLALLAAADAAEELS